MIIKELQHCNSLIFMSVVRGPVMPAGEMCGKICSERTLYMKEADVLLDEGMGG